MILSAWFPKLTDTEDPSVSVSRTKERRCKPTKRDLPDPRPTTSQFGVQGAWGGVVHMQDRAWWCQRRCDHT